MPPARLEAIMRHEHCLHDCILDYDHEDGECWTESEKWEQRPKVPPKDAPENVQKDWLSYRRAVADAVKAANKERKLGRAFECCRDCGKPAWLGCECIPF